MASYSQCAQYVTLLWIQAKTMSSVEDITTHRTKRAVLPACPLPSACCHAGEVGHSTPKLASVASQPRKGAVCALHPATEVTANLLK